jgi:hypothetical protein
MSSEFSMEKGIGSHQGKTSHVKEKGIGYSAVAGRAMAYLGNNAGHGNYRFSAGGAISHCQC